MLTFHAFPTDPSLPSVTLSLLESFFFLFPTVFSMTPSGSALQDGILFGRVGAPDWGGSVLWLEEGRRLFPPRTALEDEFPPALQNHAAYLGE